jgi:L-lactate dehydrogenase complex protein LldG
MKGNAREKILGEIRKALDAHSLEMPFPESDKLSNFYVREELSIEEKFAKEFNALGGKFVYCANESELFVQLQSLSDTMQWKKIHCKDSFLLTLFQENGLQLLQPAEDMHAAQDYGRALPVYSPIHITIAFADQLVWDLEDALKAMQEKYGNQLPSLISLTTGPSRTADIEKTLVVGVHGPKEVYVFLVDRHWMHETT